MKEKTYILFKSLRKHAIPLLLATMAMFLFFIAIINPPKVYAQSQIAKVDHYVNIVEGQNSENISFNEAIVSNDKNTVINFDKIDVALTKNSIIEIDITVENLIEQEINLTLKLNQDRLENFAVMLYVNDVVTGELTEYSHSLQQKEIVNIQVVVKIDNVARNAILSGDLSLNITQVG